MATRLREAYADVGSVAVDEVHGYVYWSGNSKCTRAKLDGSAQEDIVTGVGLVLGLAVDPGAGKVYISNYNGGKVEVANLDGTERKTFILHVSTSKPMGIALDLTNGPKTVNEERRYAKSGRQKGKKTATEMGRVRDGESVGG
ncbi:hypothetical protein LSAT2_025940, partial [Lamellibrachia satsuma]